MAALERHNQPEYKRWAKLLNGLYMVKEVLCPYVQQVLDEFHSKSLRGSLGAFCCTAGNLKPKQEVDKTEKKWSIINEEGESPDCTDRCCTDWLDTVAAEHLEGNRKDMFRWIDLMQLNFSSWEIGKTFLTKDQAASTSGPADLDPYFLMKMITQCRLFSQEPHDIHDAVQKVLDTRNELAHAAKQDIKTEADFRVKMTEMIDLVRLLPTALPSAVADLEKVAYAMFDHELSQKELDVVQRFLQQHLDVLRSLREELADTYLAHYSQMQPVPWANITLPINLIYQEQRLQESKSAFGERDSKDAIGKRDSKGASGERNRLSKLKSILEPSAEGSRPSRLLIQGEPGMGKSTTVHRLLESWALGVHASRPALASNPQAASHDELEGSRLHEYMLVLFLRVRELNGGDLVENLLSNLVHDCWRVKDIKERLVRCIRDNIKHVLLLVDGYDEGDEEQKKSVDKWLTGRGCQGITIIVTSRPGFCRPSPPPDTTYTLEGLDQNKQRSYAQRFDELMGTEPGQKSAAEQLEELPFQHLDFLQNPLMLALVCVLARQGQSVLPQSVTGLYNMFVQFMSDKAMRDPINFSKGHLSKLLKLLQKVAFDLFGLKQSEMTSDNLSKDLETSETNKTWIDLCKFGLVCQEIKLKGLRVNQTGTFLHQSFQDYFAACHFVSLSKENRSALLRTIVIHENMLVFVAGLCGESEKHRKCFKQMMKAWKRAVKRDWDNHSVRHACLLWVGELQDPAWLRADHVTDIKLGGIVLDYRCTASCMRGVTALVRCAAHQDSLSSHSAQQRPSPLQRSSAFSRQLGSLSSLVQETSTTLNRQRHSLSSHSAQQHPSPLQRIRSALSRERPSLSSHSAQQHPSPLQRIRSALSRQRHSLSSHEPLNLGLHGCHNTALSALHDLLHPSLSPNVKLTCEVLSMPECLTSAECERLGAVLPRLNDLRELTVTVSSLTELTAVSCGFNSTSRLHLLTVYCSSSSPRDSSFAAAEPWSPSDELISNIRRLHALERIELHDDESTLTTENKRDITRRLTARLPPDVQVKIVYKDLQTGHYRYKSLCEKVGLRLGN